MKTILARTEKGLTCLRSTFHAILVPLSSPKEVRPLWAVIKKEHPKARHLPYAWRFLPQSGSSDDGEPKGTAGRPLLDLLAKCELDRVLLVVVRYFGGTLLGAARLLKTFRAAGTMVIKEAKIVDLKISSVWEISLSYHDHQILLGLIKTHDIKVLRTAYGARVILEAAAAEKTIDFLHERLPEAKIRALGTRPLSFQPEPERLE